MAVPTGVFTTSPQMSDFDGAPTGATGPYMTSFEDDDEMFAALDWHVDPTLSDYWDRVTIDQLLNMSDEKFSRTVMEWQRITQASNLDITSIDIDSDCRALLDNSLEFGELTEAPGASASVPLEPSVPVTSAPETTSSKGKKPLTAAAIKAAAWRRRRKEKDPNFADKERTRRREAYADLQRRIVEGEEPCTKSGAQRSAEHRQKKIAEDPEWVKKDNERRRKAHLKKKEQQNLTKEADATEQTESQDEDAEGESE